MRSQTPRAEIVTIAFIVWIWVITVILISFHNVSAEGLMQRRTQSDQWNVKKMNIINTKDKAKVLLQRYGYLRCKIGHRRRHSTTNSTSNVGIQSHGKNLSNTKSKKHQSHLSISTGNWTKHCTPKELREAVRLYQRHYNIRETGRLDTATLDVMSASRCGNPDDEIGVAVTITNLDPISNTADNRVEESKKNRGTDQARRKRSSITLKDFLRKRQMAKVASTNRQVKALIRRKKWIQEYVAKLRSGEVDRRLTELHSTMQKRRRKRSVFGSHDQTNLFSKDVISWRLLNGAHSHQMSNIEQRSSLANAFRRWSEVIPRIFFEDNISSVYDVDILIAFGRGDHMNCRNKFDGDGGQLSHAIRQYEGAEIHVDDDEHFTIDSETGKDFLKVAVHEIGHILGLIHTQRNYSIMYAIYSEALPSKTVELTQEDRKVVQAIYGTCKGSFDIVFDWVRRRPKDGQLIYNTYFFRDDNYWMYENRCHRPRYGDPLKIGTEFKGVPKNMDGFVHIFFNDQDSNILFKDSQYWKVYYDDEVENIFAGHQLNISEGFGSMLNTSNAPIPDNIDAVYFDKRDDNIYFFKENMVYAYDASKDDRGCCLEGYPRLITDEYPHDTNSAPLPNNLDAVYYSYTDRSLYFFKGHFYWQNVGFNQLDRHRKNLVRGPFPIHDKWHDICDAEPF